MSKFLSKYNKFWETDRQLSLMATGCEQISYAYAQWRYFKGPDQNQLCKLNGKMSANWL